MSVFPYNNDKYDGSDEYNGSPLNMKEAIDLAEKILRWHSDNDTSDWTQSNDGHMLDVSRLSYGLIAVSSDPNFIRWIQIIGKDIIRRCETIVEVHEMYKDEKYKPSPGLVDMLKELGIIEDKS